MAAVSKRGKIGWIVDSVRKYAVDFSVNFSSKGRKGNLQLHRTVQEELKDGGSLRGCKDRQISETISISEKEITKIEKLPEEGNAMKLKDGLNSTEKLKPISSNKLPPEQVKEKQYLNPNSKRILIRSRL